MTEAAAFVAGTELERRARQSLGSSDEAIHRMVITVLDTYGVRGGTFLDVGCGAGALRAAIGSRFEHYVGLDALRYESFPQDATFHAVDLDADQWPVASESADVVAAVETIEHLENAWAFVRKLARLARPGGWVFVTTPNQLSALSLLTLVTKGRFSAFQDVHFPTHRTALLASDLERAAREAGLVPVTFEYSRQGRLPFSAFHYPRWLAAICPRALSDNLLLVSRKPAGR